MKAKTDESYRLLGARHVRRHAKRLAARLEGARAGGDIEFVHQARVASRRLRAGFQLFGNCFGAAKVKRWRKAVRRVTRRLGPARDKDVQIAFVRGVLAGLEPKTLRPGVQRLLLRLEQQRAALQKRVVKAADRALAGGELAQMSRLTGRLASRLKKKRVPPASPFVFRTARDQIVARWDALRQYEGSLKDPEDLASHHRMRIAAKRLRYTLEICRPAYAGQLDEAVGEVRGLQERLGEIHDCDVWVEHIGRFMAEERQRAIDYCGSARPFGRLEAGLAYLRDERLARRREAFEQLVREWRRLADGGLWARLLGILEVHVRPPAPAGDSEQPEQSPSSERTAAGGDGSERTDGHDQG